MKNKKFTDVVDAWHFLLNHPYYSKPLKTSKGWMFVEGFEESISAQPVKYNPKKNKISNKQENNTKPAVWLDSGCFYFDNKTFSHDYNLDISAGTWEKAIIKLANKVLKLYGNLNIYNYFTSTEKDFSKWNKVINGKYKKEEKLNEKIIR